MTDDSNIENSDRVEHAEDIGRQEDKVTSAAQEAIEEVTGSVADSVDKAEEAAEEVVQTVVEASEKAAEKADIPELAGAVADIVINRLREAGLSVSQITEEATDAAQDIAETVEESAEEAMASVDSLAHDVADTISPSPEHWWYKWPPSFPRRSRNR